MFRTFKMHYINVITIYSNGEGTATVHILKIKDVFNLQNSKHVQKCYK